MLAWIFVTLTLIAPGPPTSTTHGPFADEAACEQARSAWLRDLVGRVEILDLGQCRLAVK